MHRPLVGTPSHIKAAALEVLRPLEGMSYADALYALEVALRTMQDAIDRLHAEQVFSPPIFRHSTPRDEGGRP